MLRILLCLILSLASARAGTRTDPSTWILWRAAPIDFPDTFSPQVPELRQGEAPIDFQPDGSDLTIVMPDAVADDYDGRALDFARRFLVNKVPRAKVVAASKISAAHLRNHLLVIGTLDNHAFARRVLGPAAAEYLAGLRPRGYRIGTFAHPAAADKRAILALGVDLKGAYSAGVVLCHAIHPNREGVNELKNWPVRVPEGCYWLPFEATANPPAAEYEVTRAPHPAPPRPLVPVAARVWGSPMPTLASYQRLVRTLKTTGMNSIVVQSGGLVDLPDAADRFVKLLDIAWQEGLYTCLYVGNEEEAHRSAPLSANHRAVILATKDHPGLLAFHLYNQLGTKHTPGEYRDLEQQVRWINSLTARPTSIEIVWGHNVVPIPPDKQKLMREVRSWGLDIIGTDYAPIGGWSQEPYLPRWEKKILELRPFEERTEVLLQAHVPFLGATVPSREQVINQFWWALAGGAHGFFVEAACLFTHFSMRGLVTWNCQPQPDGRFDAVREIAAAAPRMARFIRDGRILSSDEAAATGLALAAAPPTLHLRMRTLPDGTRFALAINEDLARPATARLTLKAAGRYRATDILAERDAGTVDSLHPLALDVPPGRAVCFELQSMPSP
ncbi:MAG: hypothetical protein EXS37_10585 [Opitutus sp.]|nr:hypothetical protein [Opitutus sp.]